ncbi:conserved membrane hypothetical protein [Luteimonas sp. 9C]|uniref:hypothetical protein n=1 Tax=Luteimonas sp. 9C TaxID=2653148 RepID=UPI0012F228BA|nr:hypothetical protein [Luteimonas sp. 9C]VXB47582.1 conserved membrane hypothetical protein [Luteimonas sp. 9C]
MSPRLEYTLVCGALALTLTLALGGLLEMGIANAFFWELASVAMLAAALAAAWVAGWRWRAGRRTAGRRVLAMACATALTAAVLFVPMSLGLVALLAPGDDSLSWVYSAAVFGAPGLAIGLGPACLVALLPARRYLGRVRHRGLA